MPIAQHAFVARVPCAACGARTTAAQVVQVEVGPPPVAVVALRCHGQEERWEVPLSPPHQPDDVVAGAAFGPRAALRIGSVLARRVAR